MKPHGIKADLTYELINNNNKVLSKTIISKLEGYVDFENLKTGKKARLPFRSFVDNFIQTIHGFLTGDGGDDTRLQSVSCAATNASKASQGLLIGTDLTSPIITDTSIVPLKGTASTSLLYSTHNFTAPFYSGDKSMFNLSRVIANNKVISIYPEEVGIYTRGLSAYGVPSASAPGRLITKDSNAITISPDESIRITFNFEASMDSTYGGIVLNFVKLIYNYMFRGNLNHTTSRIVSRTGTYPTYGISVAPGAGSKAATLGDLFIASSGSGYIGIVLEPYDDKMVANSPGNTSINADHTGLTVGANTVSAIEYVSINNGAQFSITRNFTNAGSSTKHIGRIGLLTRGDSSNVTGSVLHADQILLMLNTPNELSIAPGQILKVTYNFGIQV